MESERGFLNLSVSMNSPADLKMPITDLVGLGFCSSTKLSGDASAAGPWDHVLSQV